MKYIIQFQVNVVAYDLLNMHVFHTTLSDSSPYREHHRSNQDQEQRSSYRRYKRQHVRYLDCMFPRFSTCSVPPQTRDQNRFSHS
jgi:hypothetical protein